MADTAAAVLSTTTGVLQSSTTAALSSSTTGSTATGALSSSIVSTTQSVNITSLVSVRLDMTSTSYRCWKNLFLTVLGRFQLQHHVDGSTPRHNDPLWVQEDLTVLMWIHATLADDLMDMVMEFNSTAFGAWQKVAAFFSDNKPSRAAQLEAEFHNLQQGDLSAAAYCHKLKTLADALADCDHPVTDRTLVYQMVRGMNSRYHVLKTLLPKLPQFPTFMQARSYLIMEENSKDSESQPSTESALVAGDNSNSTSHDTSSERPDHSNHDRANATNSSRGYRGGSRGGYRGRGRGRGGRGFNNSGRGGQQQQHGPPAWLQHLPPWAAPWMFSGNWRAPWTGATGPGVLGARPTAPGHAFPAMLQPTTASAPLAASTWDSAGLLHALQTASLQQPSHSTEWFMDTGASSHMTGDPGSSNQERDHQVQ